MNVRLTLITALATTCFALTSLANASQQDGVDQSAAVYELAQMTAPLKSRAALHDHLSQDLHESPLRYLSAAALRRFVGNITFNEKGVTGFSYEDLERELTVTQAYQVLALFGQQQFVSYLKGARVETGLDAALLRGDVPGVGIQCAVHPVIRSLGGAMTEQLETIQCDGFLEGYRCYDAGTCSEAVRMACTSNC